MYTVILTSNFNYKINIISDPIPLRLGAYVESFFHFPCFLGQLLVYNLYYLHVRVVAYHIYHVLCKSYYYQYAYMCSFCNRNLDKKSQEENLKLKKLKAQLGQPLSWSDYLSLPFTQTVS